MFFYNFFKPLLQLFNIKDILYYLHYSNDKIIYNQIFFNFLTGSSPSIIESPTSKIRASSFLEFAIIPKTSSPNLIDVEKSDSWIISSILYTEFFSVYVSQ